MLLQHLNDHSFSNGKICEFVKQFESFKLKKKQRSKGGGVRNGATLPSE